MKKLLSIILSIIMLLSMLIISTSVSAKVYTSGDYEYKILSDNTATITLYKGREKEINIPSKLDGYKVTKIGRGAFLNTKKSTNFIKIPSSVFEIGIQALGPVKKLYLGKNVSIIKDEVFSSSETLQSISVSKKNKHFISKAGVLYNKTMTKLVQYPISKKGKSFKIPKGVKTIGAFSFAFNKLKKVVFSDTVQKIESAAFSYSERLRKINIPPNIKIIGKYAFLDCENVIAININPNKNLKIEDKAFHHCKKIQKLIVPPAKGKGVFMYCENLKEITIPSNVSELTEKEFYGCNKLYTVTVPKSVKKIRKMAIGYKANEYDYSPTKVGGFTIKGKKGSAAQKYAKANGFKFIAI